MFRIQSIYSDNIVITFRFCLLSLAFLLCSVRFVGPFRLSLCVSLCFLFFIIFLSYERMIFLSLFSGLDSGLSSMFFGALGRPYASDANAAMVAGIGPVGAGIAYDPAAFAHTMQDPAAWPAAGATVATGMLGLLGQSPLYQYTEDQIAEYVDPLMEAMSPQPSAAGVGSAASGFPGLKPSTFDYINAELAGLYGMDRNTAYQEALSNTAYQRSVADMKAAGLNPAAIFGNGRGSSASGVGYVGSSGSGSAASVDSGKLFSSEDFGLIASLAGLATAVVTKKPANFWLGQQGAQAVMTVLNGIDKKMK